MKNNWICIRDKMHSSNYICWVPATMYPEDYHDIQDMDVLGMFINGYNIAVF